MTTTSQTPAEIMAEARETYRQSVAAEMPLSGQKLGEMFGKSRSWGRDRIAEARAEDSGTDGGGTVTDTPDEVAAPAAAAPVPAVVEPVAEEPVTEVAEVPEVGAAAVTAAAPGVIPGGGAPSVPWQARSWAWAGFGLGTLASIAANVAHAQDTVGAKLSGAFVPVALIIAVEIMCRPIWQRPGWHWQLARYGGTGLVALVTAVMSYGHMHGLLLSYGETQINAAIGPLAVDGLMVISGFGILAMSHKRGNR